MKLPTLLLVIIGMIATQVSVTEAEAILIIIIHDVEYNTSSRITGMLKDGPSISYKLNNWPLPSRQDSPNDLSQSGDHYDMREQCIGSEAEIQILKDAMERTVKYVERHVGNIFSFDAHVGLQVLEGEHAYAKKRGQSNSTLPARVKPLIEQINTQAIIAINDKLTKQAAKIITKHENLFARDFSDWKNPDILVKRRSDFPNVGQDPETVWITLNTQCIAALLNNCDVPYTCERTYLKDQPQSQYMLTHQALYLLFARKTNCDTKRPELFGNVDSSLESQCGKMLLEAELLAQNAFPAWGKDLFAEYVFICGQAGYPNFLRKDWIQEILSWQSKSEYGCFLNPELNADYRTTEVRILREETEQEREIGVKSEEICYSHLTSTSLSALAMRLGCILDNC
ncbi:UPF0764 protein C16orf89 homolog [Folsomia candida]|uniref:Uncharacterized protein n=1 Tax=Folsomia candida TaxID=158441 RepID=A0A226DP63_FOLCA|nr:UPF0764 protein C16orf89 homolog [Folsomia candida]OXA46999.1 hypothetical protein Fcan01_18135 [Folsomia candida]